jgi:hypothetical protein
MGTPRKLSALILDDTLSGFYRKKKRIFLLKVSEPDNKKTFGLELKDLEPEIGELFSLDTYDNYYKLDSKIEAYCKWKCQGNDSEYLFNLVLLQTLNNIISNMKNRE